MKKIPSDVYNQFELVAKRVLTDLKTRGFVVPIRGQQGSLKFEDFVVIKNPNGLYSVKGGKVTYFDDLNLPQTAAIIANDLAVGRILDSNLVNLDRDYGFKLFEEEVYRRASKRKKNTLDQVVFYDTRKQIAKSQKNAIKDRIMKSFKKLTNIV